ncbi:MAG: hypothetical protein HKL84_06755 [Acidimicrobiaceae bacterium]|nr:hypothetical protein [Acidimicrobiaceae bacterium]
MIIRRSNLKKPRTSRARAATVGISVATAGMILAACGSSSSSGSSSTSGASTTTTSATAAAAAFFKGKTITLIAPDNPGGGYDQYARLIAPGLAAALGATVNVENVNGGGTVVGTNQMAAAAPDGLTLGMINTGGDLASLVEKKPGQSFDLSKLSYVGQPGTSPSVFLTSPKSGVTSFSQLLTIKTPIKVVDVRNGTGDMFNRVVLGAFNIPHTFITGFTSTSTLKQGFLAGDGQYLFENLPPMRSMLDGGQAKALLVTFQPTLANLQASVKGAVTLSDALSSVSLGASQQAAVKEALALGGLTYDLGGPPGIPAARLAVLRDALAKVVAESSTIAQASKEGVPLNFVPGATIQSEVVTAVKNASLIAPYVNGS